MITEALLHYPGIGPVRLARLHDQGIRSWSDVLANARSLPARWRAAALEESQRCLAALETNDIAYFVEHLSPKDRWRILMHYLREASFFDIETAGLEVDDPVTVIVCWHQGSIHTFVEHENLDDFVDMLPEMRLLVSFNGGSFDVPRVIDTFHLPTLPCPHLDLRWLCFHHGWRGGLKEITCRQGIARPRDLQFADGELAIRLWARWQHFADLDAKRTLLRYCASDVLLLVALAQQLVGQQCVAAEDLWKQLPAATQSEPLEAEVIESMRLAPNAFGEASPSRLRARRRLVG